MADMSMEALLSALQTTQAVVSKVRLSERNVVELVNKLKSLGILGDDLLHTINGREYITVARLQEDVRAALVASGGRLALVELPALVGVDLFHCEKQAAALVAASGGKVVELQGELIATLYFDNIAAEINDMLQEAGKVRIGELAAQYALNTELLLSCINARLGTVIQGRLEGGLLYTPAHLRNIKAQLRGALRGTSSPVTLPSVVKLLGLDAGGGVGVLAALTEELIQEGTIRGSLRGGTNWIPAIYAATQAEAVRTFYTQNGWIGYDTVRRTGISNERTYMKTTFPDGLALDAVYCSPALVAQVEGAAEDAAAAGSWVDVVPLLPSALAAADVAQLLERSAGVQALVQPAGADGAAAEGVRVLAGTCIVSNRLIQGLQQRADLQARAAAEAVLVERKKSGGVTVSIIAAPGSAATPSTGGKGSKKGTPVAVAAAASDSDEEWAAGSKKGGGGGKGSASAKKKGGAGKATPAKALATPPATKGGAAAQSTPAGVKAPGITSRTLVAKVSEWQDDMLGAGAGSDKALVTDVAQALLPGALAAYDGHLAAAFTAGCDARRRARDVAGRALDEALQRLQLLGRGVEHFVADEATYSVLQRHLARTTGAECVEHMYRWVQAEQDSERDTGASSSADVAERPPVLSAADRTAILRAAPPDVVAALTAAAEGLAAGTVKEVESVLDNSSGRLGMRPRKLDKKGEKAAVAAHRQRLLDSLAAESTPAGVLALAVPLLATTATGKALSLPGKAIGGVLAALQGQLTPEVHATVSEYHALVVAFLKAQPAAGATHTNGDGAAAALEADLAQRVPHLKALLGWKDGSIPPAAASPAAAPDAASPPATLAPATGTAGPAGPAASPEGVDGSEARGPAQTQDGVAAAEAPGAGDSDAPITSTAAGGDRVGEEERPAVQGSALSAAAGSAAESGDAACGASGAEGLEADVVDAAT